MDHFLVGYVSRNARRKMPSDIIMSWKIFLDELEKKYGHRKATLVMHTEPLDPEGRSYKNTMKMMTEDGLFNVLPKYEDAWLNFLDPFMRLTRIEKNYKNKNKKIIKIKNYE